MENNTEIAKPTNPGYFARWYDLDIQLSELVHSLETLTEESQMLFAFLLTFFSDEIVRIKGRLFFKEMEWDKLVGIYKSKSGRRWYDRQEVLHKAFNKLYSLNEDDKAAIARELFIPSRIVKKYEEHCQGHKRQPDMETVFAIVATSFKEGTDEAQSRYQAFD